LHNGNGKGRGETADPEEIRSRLERIRSDSGVRIMPTEINFIDRVLDGELKLAPGNQVWDQALKIVESYWKIKAAHGKARPIAAKEEPRGRFAVIGEEAIDPARIVPGPFQPRHDFPKEEIEGLAESLKTQGQLVPVVVRHCQRESKVGKWELIFGEKRVRAARLAKLPTVRAEVVDADDVDVRQAILAEVLQRAGLNAIEEARAFRASIDAGDAPGPTELARQLGLSQGHVSNRLRLLELSEATLRQVILQKIPPTNVLQLLPLKAFPAIIEAIVKAPKAADMSGSDFRSLVFCKARDKCRKMDKSGWESSVSQHVPAMKPSATERAELGIIAIAGPWDARPCELATNVKLFDQLWNAHKKAVVAKTKKQGRVERGGGRVKTKKLTPAQEAAREKEKIQQFVRRLYEWKENWMRYLIAETLRTAADIHQVCRVLAMGLTHWLPSLGPDDLDAVLDKGSAGRKGGVAVKAIFCIENFELDKKLGALASAMFYDEEQGPRSAVYGADLEALCEFGLEIDLNCEWNNHQAGPLSEAFWRLHTKDQLVELAGELKTDFDDKTLRGTKEQLVAAFVARIPKEEDKEAGLPLPKEIKKAKGR
jgi:ParB/RepB/Spo0J family partition protein